MIKLDSVEAFAVIVETGSISEAARRLMLSKSVVSERLSDLERALKTKLLQRSTRKLHLTADGTAFFKRAKNLLRDADAAVSEVAERRGALRGPLRISGPVSFGNLHLGPALFGFVAKHPEIELTLEVDDRFVDLLAEGYDAVIRHGPVHDKRVITKHLAISRRVLVASPAYLEKHGNPATLRELGQHRGIIYSNRGALDWRFRSGKKWVSVQPGASFNVNNGLIMRDAAIAGLGIALLTTFIVSTALKDKTLQVVDVGAEAEGATLHIAYPEHLRASAKVRALTAWLRQSFGDPAYWDKLPARR